MISRMQESLVKVNVEIAEIVHCWSYIYRALYSANVHVCAVACTEMFAMRC